MHRTQGRVCVEPWAGYPWNPGQGMHGALGREHLWVKVHNMISQKIMKGNHPGTGNNKIPMSGYVRGSYPGQGALSIRCSGYVPFLVPWPGCTAHALLRVP